MRFTNIEYTNFLYDKKYEFQISQKPIVLLLAQDYLNNSEIKRGWRRLALNSTPIPQGLKLPGRCAEVKPKFAFFQEQRERFAINSVVFAQDAFCLIPESSQCCWCGSGGRQIPWNGWCGDGWNRSRLTCHSCSDYPCKLCCPAWFLFDNRHKSIGLGIIYDNGIDPSVAFQDAKDNHFPCAPRPRLPLRRPPK